MNDKQRLQAFKTEVLDKMAPKIRRCMTKRRGAGREGGGYYVLAGGGYYDATRPLRDQHLCLLGALDAHFNDRKSLIYHWESQLLTALRCKESHLRALEAGYEDWSADSWAWDADDPVQRAFYRLGVNIREMLG